jgi:hypothetical protein
VDSRLYEHQDSGIRVNVRIVEEHRDVTEAGGDSYRVVTMSRRLTDTDQECVSDTSTEAFPAVLCLRSHNHYAMPVLLRRVD